MADLRDKSEVSGLRTKLNRTKTEVQSLATRSRSPSGAVRFISKLSKISHQ